MPGKSFWAGLFLFGVLFGHHKSRRVVRHVARRAVWHATRARHAVRRPRGK